MRIRRDIETSFEVSTQREGRARREGTYLQCTSLPGEDSGLALVSEEIGDAHAEFSAEDLCVAFEELRSPTVQSRVHTYTVSYTKEGKEREIP